MNLLPKLIENESIKSINVLGKVKLPDIRHTDTGALLDKKLYRINPTAVDVANGIIASGEVDKYLRK